MINGYEVFFSVTTFKTSLSTEKFIPLQSVHNSEC